MNPVLKGLFHAALGAFASAFGAALQGGSTMEVAWGAAIGSALSSAISLLSRSPLPGWWNDGDEDDS